MRLHSDHHCAAGVAPCAHPEPIRTAEAQVDVAAAAARPLAILVRRVVWHDPKVTRPVESPFGRLRHALLMDLPPRLDRPWLVGEGDVVGNVLSAGMRQAEPSHHLP